MCAPSATKTNPRQPDYIGGPNKEPINSRSIESYERAATGGVGGANFRRINSDESFR